MARPQSRRPRYKAMIVAPQPEATEAGHITLKAGGNALDAVIACALTQGVVDPMMCGIGGLGNLHIFDPKRGESIIFDGLSTCPAASKPGMWESIFEKECDDGYGFVLKGCVNELGHTAVTTPGIVRVFGDAHRIFGKLKWATLFDPAVDFAEEGWIVRPHVATMFALNEAHVGRLPFVRKLAHTAEGERLYMRTDGTHKKLGDMVKNPDLAAALRTLARDGAESFYTGEIAARLADDMARNGGLMTLNDLKNFKVQQKAPLTIRYRGRTIAAPPPPAGGIFICQILRMLERFDLTGFEHNSAEYIAVIAEAMKIAGADKDRFIGDPDFIKPPLERLLSDSYADECAAKIRRGEKTPLARVTADANNTTTVSCIDADGMIVSLTHTLGTPSGVIPPGLGFMLNGAMNWYDPRPGRAGSIAPGKRRFSTMTPTIVFEDGKPVFTVSAPGGAWIGVAILQVLLNVLDWGMGVTEAVAAPRFSATSDVIDISNRIPRGVQKALEAKGYEVRRSPLSYPFAAPHGITCWDGVLEGGADPQRDGYAAGLA
jgi:gamma-glutamyltranspeptidase/glutathione hydrolase